MKRARIFCTLAFIILTVCPLHAQMNPFFTAINTPVSKGSMMLMLLPDFQVAHSGPNFVTTMGMAEYGVTDRWTAGVMVEGQKIGDMPTTFGGFRFNSYFQIFPHDRLLHLTLYGEYEDLNQAALYKMEVSGFGSGDLGVPLAKARRTPAHTFELRAIGYHDWGRIDATFNFISETDLETDDNYFGYTWGVFRQPSWNGMGEMRMPAQSMARPGVVSVQRLGYGLEMTGALGGTSQFGFDWPKQQQYIGPVLTYTASPMVTFRLEPEFGLSTVSDPFVLRIGVTYTIANFLHRFHKLEQ